MKNPRPVFSGVGPDRQYAQSALRPRSQLEILMESRSEHVGPTTLQRNVTMTSLTKVVTRDVKHMPCTSNLGSKYKLFIDTKG